MLLLDTGLRIGELVDLKVIDVHMDEGYLKVMGKGKKERIVPIGNNAQRALQRYLFRFRPKPINPIIDNVFLSTSNKPLTENSMKLMFTRLSQRSGVYRLHTHLCRHTFATRFLVNGGDVFTLQRILGHYPGDGTALCEPGIKPCYATASEVLPIGPIKSTGITTVKMEL